MIFVYTWRYTKLFRQNLILIQNFFRKSEPNTKLFCKSEQNTKLFSAHESYTKLYIRNLTDIQKRSFVFPSDLQFYFCIPIRYERDAIFPNYLELLKIHTHRTVDLVLNILYQLWFPNFGGSYLVIKPKFVPLKFDGYSSQRTFL